MRRIALLAIVCEGIATAFAWPHLPGRIALHWDLHGAPNRWGSPLELLLAGPVLLAVLWGVFELLPRIDPRLSRPPDPEQTPAERRGALDVAFGVTALLLAAVHATILLHAVGLLHEVARVHAVMVAGFLMAFGNFAGRLRPNWFIGLRTPWTLSNDRVWRRTHRFAGTLMVPAGLLLLLAAVVAPLAWVVPALVSLLLASTLGPAAMSYVWWRRREA